jgi:hypothetical protein
MRSGTCGRRSCEVCKSYTGESQPDRKSSVAEIPRLKDPRFLQQGFRLLKTKSEWLEAHGKLRPAICVVGSAALKFPSILELVLIEHLKGYFEFLLLLRQDAVRAQGAIWKL